MELEALQNNVVLVGALAGLAGLGIGSLLTYLLIGRGPSKSVLSAKLAEVEEEYDNHKKSVDAHFATTSELVNDLTESYVKVYKHLSEGAENLGGVADMRHRLTLNSTGESDADDVIEGDIAAKDDNQPELPPEDPEFQVSDEAVEETLTELEANATVANTEADPETPTAESANPTTTPPAKGTL